MPWYRKHGKILVTYSEEDFVKAMEEGHFCKPEHKGFIALLHYTGVRKGEALRAVKEQFSLQSDFLVFDVKKRFKHGKVTPPLKIRKDLPYVMDIWKAVEKAKPNETVFSFTSRTAYNIIDRVLKYPHYERLNRITTFFKEKRSIVEVQNWTGLSLQALDYYLGLVSIEEMAKEMGKSQN